MQATGHSGMAVCRIVIVRADTDEDLVALEDEMQFTGPMDFVISGRRFEDCSFPYLGVSYVQVYFDDRLCAERMFFVLGGEVATNGQGTA
jgi:hypothetical protein